MAPIPWNEVNAAHLLRRAGFGGTSAEIAQALSDGLDRTVDRLVNFESIPTTALDARLTALKQRVVDVVVISPPADTQMEKQGYKILARAYELFSFPYLGLGTHTRKIKDRPDEIRRVIKATIRANRFIRDHRDEAVATLIGWGKVEREFAYASYDALRNLFNADGAVPEEGLHLVIEQTRRTNKVTREVAPNEVVDLSFLRAAQAELGIKPR